MRRCPLVVLALLFLTPYALFAQDAMTGALQGIVQSSTGHPIPQALIQVQDVPEHTDRTQADGRFYLSGIVPGSYTVTVYAAGFAAESVQGVVVPLGAATQLVLHLRPTVRSTEIVVEASALPPALLDLDVSATSTTMTPAEMEDLPLNGRRWQSFALLTPTVVSDESNLLRMSFGGIATTQNSYTLDGFDDTQSFLSQPRGGARAAFRVPQSAVYQFRLHPVDYTAQLGSAAGGVITTVTQQGSSHWHGSIFFHMRDSLFNATDPFALVTHYNNGAPTALYVHPKDLRLQWGLNSGGPVWGTGHHLTYLVALEQQQRSFPAYSTPNTANFYQLSATQTALLQNRGVTRQQIHAALAYLDSLTGEEVRRANQTVVFPRMDWIWPNDQYSLFWNAARWSSPAGIRTRTTEARGLASFGNDHMASDDVNLRWTHRFTHDLSHQLGLGISRDLERQTAQPSLAQEPHTSPNGYAPQISIAGEFTFGKPATLGRRRYPDERREQFFDTLSWSGPASLLQVGFSMSQLQEHIATLQNEDGSYSYSSGATNGRAGGLVDWITDYTFSATAYPNGACPSIYATVHYFCYRSFTQSFGTSSTVWRNSEWSAFLQGHWRATPHLALDAGLRYEYVALPPAQHPNVSLDASFGAIARTSTLPSDTNNLAPRVAVAWSPGTGVHHTSVRLSYGVFFGRIAGATIWSALTRTGQSASVTTLRITPSTSVDGACFRNYPTTYTCSPANTTSALQSAMLFSRRFQVPMVQRVQLSVEQQIARGVLSASYLGNATRQLPNSTDINIAPSTQSMRFRVVRGDGRGEPGVRNGDTFQIPIYTARAVPQLGRVTEILSNASASSHAFVLSWHRPLSHGILLRSSWTYSKLLDYGQDRSALPDVNGQFDPFDVRYDRAASDLDHRHRIVVSALIQPSFHGGKRMTAWCNDWSVAPIFVSSSGRPYSYLMDGGTALSGGRESINGAGGLRYLPSVGRNTLHVPWSENLDLRIARQLHLPYTMQARLFADVFNLLNHINATRVQQRAFLVGTSTNGMTNLVYQDSATIAAEGITQQPFGTVTSSTALSSRQREMQFGVRVEW